MKTFVLEQLSWNSLFQNCNLTLFYVLQKIARGNQIKQIYESKLKIIIDMISRACVWTEVFGMFTAHRNIFVNFHQTQSDTK